MAEHGGRGAWAWPALALGLLLLSLLLAAAPRGVLDWQARVSWLEPWRWWTAPLVHLSAFHLAANAAGALVLGLFGRAAGCGPRETLAWAAAWPLTQALLVLDPRLQQAAGLSGVLHAGVAVAATHLVLDARGAAADRGRDAPGAARWLGVAVWAGLLLKLLGETAWQAPVAPPANTDFPIAVAMHASGAGAGLLCGVVAWATGRRARIRTIGARPADRPGARRDAALPHDPP